MESTRKVKKTSPPVTNGREITIYALIDTLLLKPIYTGKTVDADRRLGQHCSNSSSCRLVAQFVRKHGRARVGIRPLVRCNADDADTNESFYIIKNNTLYPNGLNLRHGSKAGVESGECSSLMVSASAAPPLVSEAEASRMMVVHANTVAPVDIDMASTAAGWADVAAMCALVRDLDEDSDYESDDNSDDKVGGFDVPCTSESDVDQEVGMTDAFRNELLRLVHPDKIAGKSANELANEVSQRILEHRK